MKGVCLCRYASTTYPSFEEVPCVVNSTDCTRPPTACTVQSQFHIYSYTFIIQLQRQLPKYQPWISVTVMHCEPQKSTMWQHLVQTGRRRELQRGWSGLTDENHKTWSHAATPLSLTLKNMVLPHQPTQSIFTDAETQLWVQLCNRGTRKCPQAAHYCLLHTHGDERACSRVL